MALQSAGALHPRQSPSADALGVERLTERGGVAGSGRRPLVLPLVLGGTSGRGRTPADEKACSGTIHPPGRRHRDIYDIFEGTEQIQQLVIARAISGLRIE
jgi:hypothetical protein